MAERKGLLENRFGDVIKGVGGAALVGVNPLLGLLAAPAIKNSRTKREAENQSMRESMEARDDLQGLLQKPYVNTVGPETVVQGIAPGADGVGSDSFNIPGRRSTMEAHQTPAGQKELMGILAKLDPRAATIAAMPAASRTNTTEQKLAALREEARRRNLTPEQTNAFIDENLARSGDPMQSFLLAQQVEQKRLANEAATAEAAETAEEKRRQRETQQASINSTLRGVESLYKNNQILNDSDFLRPGFGAELRKDGLSLLEGVKRMAGGDTEQEQAWLRAYGDFEKGAANLLTDMVSTLEGMDAGTDAKLRQIQKGLAGIQNEPGTNAMILSETIYDVFDIARINGLDIPDEDEWMQKARDLRNFGEPPAQQRYEEGQTASGPNGESVIYRNGAWVPNNG